MTSQSLSTESLWKKLHGCLALLAGLWLTLTSADGSAQPPTHPDAAKVKLQRETEAVAGFWIGCQGACHPSVGSLFRVSVEIKSRKSANETQFSTVADTGRCTMSLVSPTRILTNAHCLKAGVRARDVLDGYYAIFPSTMADELKRAAPRPVERVKVIRVVDVSAYQSGPEVSVSPDFAILELERPITGRPILPVVSRPFEDGRDYQVVAMWPLKDYSQHPDPTLRKETPIGALQRKEKCRSLDDTLLSFRPAAVASDYFTLFGCPAPGGNSGSPILNEKGEIVGVLSSGPEHMSVVKDAKDLVETYSASDVYERYVPALLEPRETPRFWLTGTTSKCILNSRSCVTPITNNDKSEGEALIQSRSTDAIRAAYSSGLAELAKVGSDTAFLSRFDVTDTESFPRRITAQASIECPSAEYFLNLSARLDPSGKGYEADVPFNAGKLLIDAGIDRNWRYAVRSEVRNVPETVRVRVSPTRTVERVLPNGKTESLGPLCVAE